ncbi:MAG: hypothetical protein JO301_10820, partial [Chitinophagaceae bacterium]|nr:hypothetical protein [Chitinophagaceae bacterium]
AKLGLPKLITISVFTAFGVNLFMSTFFYPSVLKFQLGNDAAAFIQDQRLDKDKLAIYGIHEGRALHFYAQHIFPEKVSAQDFQSGDMVLTSKDSVPVFQRLFPALKVLHEGPAFGVTALSLPFLNPATRDQEVPKYVIIDLDGTASIATH